MSQSWGTVAGLLHSVAAPAGLTCAPAVDHVPTERRSASLYPWNLGGGYGEREEELEKCFSKLTPQSQGKEADLCSSSEILRGVWLGKPGRAKLSWNGK